MLFTFTSRPNGSCLGQAQLRLTAACQPGKKQTDYYDTVCTGFALECHRSGTNTYTFCYQDAYGRQTQRRIGGYPSSNDAARLLKACEASINPQLHNIVKLRRNPSSMNALANLRDIVSWATNWPRSSGSMPRV